MKSPVQYLFAASNNTYVPKTFVFTKLNASFIDLSTWVSAAKLEKISVKREKKDIPFVMANGGVVTRSVGFSILRVANHFTIDEVVFAEPGDLMLLGARTLEGLNLAVDSARKKLIAAGPLPAA